MSKLPYTVEELLAMILSAGIIDSEHTEIYSRNHGLARLAGALLANAAQFSENHGRHEAVPGDSRVVPLREGLKETPERFAKAFLNEWCSGYSKNPKEVLKVFADGASGVDEMVTQTNIPVWSLCEHHMAPFFGSVCIAYIPNGDRIVGLSKLTRLVNVFSRRLQVQERLTQQIAEALHEHLSPDVAVVMECRHTCMESRGVGVQGVATTTSCMFGVFRSGDARREFLTFVRSSKC